MFALKHRLILSTLAGSLALVVASPAFADQGAVEIDGFVGWHVVSDSSNLGKPQNARQVLDDGGLFGMRVGYFFTDRLSLEGELAIISSNAAGDDDDDATMFGYRAQLVFALANLRELGGTLSLVGGIGGLTTTASDKHGTAGNPDGVDAGSRFMPQLGLAAKVAIAEDWGLRFDGRTFFGGASGFSGDDVALDWEATFGIYKHFEEAPAKKAVAVEPEAAPVDGDSDGDGIADSKDKCPADAEDKDGFQDEDGCPDLDNDGDGIPDAQDKAPDAAEDKDGFQDEDGAPDPDNDGDGVLDADDKCPTEQETHNGFQDKDGCADEVPKALAKFTGAIKGINFATGKAIIARSSYGVLDAAVKVLKEYPDLTLEIGGHTDDVGDADKNRALSQARAEAVMAYLVSKGVAAERLRAVGYGPDKPIDPAKTAAARAKNRRVEFVLVSQ